LRTSTTADGAYITPFIKTKWTKTTMK
jgi:hypothetical protein